MARSVAIRHLLLCLVLGGTASMCAAQAYTPPPPPLTTLPPCPVPKDAKEAKKIARRKDCDPTNRPIPPHAPAEPATGAADSAAKQFPFPGQQPDGVSSSAAKAFPYPGEAPKSPEASPAKQIPYPGDRDGEYVANPNVPHDPAAEKKAADTSAGKAFPYPGSHESDPAPATAPAASGSVPAPESSSSSSSSTPSSDVEEPVAKGTAAKSTSSNDDDDDQPKLTDKGSQGKRNKKTVKPQTDTERVDEDLSVAKYYGQSGNAMGAYLRAKDAVKTEPDLPEARFVLGEAAKRLNKTDEVKAEFTAYLKLAPDGEHARAVEKTLAEMQ